MKNEVKNTFELIYTAVEKIPCGKVATYGSIAALVGNPRLARVVGYALHVNPRPGIIPCHRVVGSGGSLTGYAGGLARKIWLQEHEGVDMEGLFVEGVVFEDDGHIDLEKYGWDGR